VDSGSSGVREHRIERVDVAVNVVEDREQSRKRKRRGENARVDLHVHEWGDPAAPVVLCLHGIGGHGARFRRLAEERLLGFHVLAPDLRGHGRSIWEPPWTLAHHVQDLQDLLLERDAERVTVVGHSFGGRLALELTAAGVVERSVLLDPVVWLPPPLALDRAERAVEELAFASLEEALANRTTVATLAPPELIEDELRTHLVEGADGLLRFRCSRAAVVTGLGELAHPPPDWDRLRVPTLLVYGGDSDVVPEVVVDVLEAELGDLLVSARVPGAHYVLWDAYAETSAAVAAFLRS
jgi:lipase